MATSRSIQVGPLRENELEEADRICRVAFGTFLRLPEPERTMGDRHFVKSRYGLRHVKAIAAREEGRLIGSNFVTRWGSFGTFGPLTVLPEYQDRGVAQRLLEATVAVFENWGVRQSGLFTFSNSAKHIALYQKFGYWPGYLTTLMTRAPGEGGSLPVLLSGIRKSRRDAVIRECGKLTQKIEEGLDPGDEIRAVLARDRGDVVLTYTRDVLDGFAVCVNGPGSEGGEKICYVKFGAARGGAGAGARFDRLLESCEAFAGARGVTVEAGVNLAREEAYRRMRARGYRMATVGVAMQRPHAAGFNRAGVYVVDDWR